MHVWHDVFSIATDVMFVLFSSLMPKISEIFLTIRRNVVSFLFPTLCAWAIYADWSRTREYKALKAKKLGSAEDLVV